MKLLNASQWDEIEIFTPKFQKTVHKGWQPVQHRKAGENGSPLSLKLLRGSFLPDFLSYGKGDGWGGKEDVPGCIPCSVRSAPRCDCIINVKDHPTQIFEAALSLESCSCLTVPNRKHLLMISIVTPWRQR